MAHITPVRPVHFERYSHQVKDYKQRHPDTQNKITPFDNATDKELDSLVTKMIEAGVPDDDIKKFIKKYDAETNYNKAHSGRNNVKK